MCWRRTGWCLNDTAKKKRDVKTLLTTKKFLSHKSAIITSIHIFSLVKEKHRVFLLGWSIDQIIISTTNRVMKTQICFPIIVSLEKFCVKSSSRKLSKLDFKGYLDSRYRWIRVEVKSLSSYNMTNWRVPQETPRILLPRKKKYEEGGGVGFFTLYAL